MSKSIWKKRKSKTKVSFFQISGEKDDAIPKLSNGTAESSFDPAIEHVLEYYVNSNGIDFSSPEIESIDNASALTKYKGKDSENQIWHLFVADGHHSWPDLQFNKIDTNNLILDFLDSVK